MPPKASIYMKTCLSYVYIIFVKYYHWYSKWNTQIIFWKTNIGFLERGHFTMRGWFDQRPVHTCCYYWSEQIYNQYNWTISKFKEFSRIYHLILLEFLTDTWFKTEFNFLLGLKNRTLYNLLMIIYTVQQGCLILLAIWASIL